MNIKDTYCLKDTWHPLFLIIAPLFSCGQLLPHIGGVVCQGALLTQVPRNRHPTQVQPMQLSLFFYFIFQITVDI